MRSSLTSITPGEDAEEYFDRGLSIRIEDEIDTHSLDWKALCLRYFAKFYFAPDEMSDMVRGIKLRAGTGRLDVLGYFLTSWILWLISVFYF
jgi:hypothetical protein